jgi:hypothetical protein
LAPEKYGVPISGWRRERNWDRTFSEHVCVVRRGTTQTDPGLRDKNAYDLIFGIP